ncbi:MAG: rod shape-determining protein MreC [Pseudomonadota bacterium]|nr:rod shape-determining protein MreC [Pseudomonadota bacterium]
MKYRVGSVARVTVPIRALLSRFALILLVLAAFGIMLLGKAEIIAVERTRVAILDIVTPVMGALSQPIATLSEGVNRVGHFFNVFDENSQLRQQNARLLHWQNAALALAEENKKFRKMLNFVAENEFKMSAARVIGDAASVFVRSLLINAGKSSGIAKGDAVVNGDGLIGRVAETGNRAARVLLITDLNSRIPVVIENSRARAILAGDNSSRPKLEFFPSNARVDTGDRVVTSGHGGVFPAGLAVGRIAKEGDDVIRVFPFADFDQLEYVRIITDFPGRISSQFIPSIRAPRVK